MMSPIQPVCPPTEDSPDRSAATVLPDPHQPLSRQWHGSIVEHFAQQTQRDPLATALFSAEGVWTYADLDEQSNQLANHLRVRGIAPAAVVAIHGRRGPALAWAILGILKARAAFVFLDPSHPLTWRTEQIRRIQPRGLIGIGLPDEKEMLTLPSATVIVDLPESRLRPGVRLFADEPLPPFDFPEDPDALAYLSFTSGTTGPAKIIAATQRPLSHFLTWHVATAGFNPSDRFVLLAGIGHDLFLRDLFTPWWCGGTLCIPSQELSEAPENLAVFLREQQVTALHLTPSTARLMCQVSNLGWPALRYVSFAGEPLLYTDVAQLQSRAPAARCVNFYGATETPQAMAQYLLPPLKRGMGDHEGVVPVGRGIEGVQLLVVNAAGELAGVGETGEIFVRTPYLARGYLNDPELTSQRFVVNPWTGAPADRMYRTGDLGRYLPDGQVVCAGRNDDQVKIRGFRVEPLGIETVLAGHPLVQHAAVLARLDQHAETQLIAYVVPRPGAVPAPAELSAHLHQRLPHHLVPARIAIMDRLPLTPRGKLDRAALRALPLPEPAALKMDDLPATPLEKTLAAIWGNLLEMPQIGIHENFFFLGGHSLTATRMRLRIEQEIGVAVSIRDIFDHPTIRQLARFLAEQQLLQVEPGELERLLAEVEAAPSPDQTVGPSLASTNKVAAAHADVIERYRCPPIPSPWFGRRDCNLILIINDRFHAVGFEKLADLVRAIDSRINVAVVPDSPAMTLTLPPRPSLIVSPAVIRHHPFRQVLPQARVFCGNPLSKSEEYTLLRRAGFPVPRWAVLARDSAPDLAGFGEYIIRKPNYGGRGASVRLVPRDRVRWKMLASPLGGPSDTTILQEFIHTGPQAVNFRVNSFFGHALYCVRHEGNAARPALAGLNDLPTVYGQEGFSVVASSQNSRVSHCYDVEIIELAEAAHQAFPDIPLLGFDIIREAATGKLFILEANAIGYVWYFDERQYSDFGFSLEHQFDGLRKAAHVLAEQTQKHAN